MLQKLILPTLFAVVCIINIAHATEPNDDVMLKCQGKHPEWYSCVTDADCSVSLDPCGWPVLGVNINHKGRSEICTRQAGAFIDCAMWRDTPENKRVAVCQEGICEAVKMSDIPIQKSKPVADESDE